MMNDSATFHLYGAEQAHKIISDTIWPMIKQAINSGQKMSLTVRKLEDERSLQQNSFYWSYVLRTIASQAKINSIGSDENGWHYFFKRAILGYTARKVKVPGQELPELITELQSTKNLTVSQMSTYMEQVMAYAANNFGITFDPTISEKTWKT